ncbi:hypothetical protein A3D00_04555 [Candidatus Woesebacteria bacterium RIFCSPHIGHO2_02_FULL_38_9]|uniref:phosphoglycerate kinase n=1 Tax=Candidatus Woesebacteria bacterium RIFCSPHIGHO2_01_FULL_39_28 TaxID=1802496 RepID=A0A1F7YN69_9BACT|nr:MAG: hypothetical protein A2627_00375 [Candidatus Woesebacteria bacterium RIFCSPHIGHO2_01_FULL_39_28]OGM31898.1 MAG: hypothetical protein A3D00_04555 [Candidatus Woesebacteria bacterium RIFCSPHIGHO2_02_FULL_38_9]OGM56732.1 MAG: hypothetical protein A3A50_05245 [Candidatus Woesebacteria bacterium RIFCSPLOWO2_01_FULL_38_20]
MNLPKVSDLDLPAGKAGVSGKRVIVRLDLNASPDLNDLRIRSSEETLNYLKSKNAKITIIAHKGRPNGVQDNNLSLKPFQKIFDRWGAKVEENLRFDPREEENDPKFAEELSKLGDFYVNEAFGASHREHASIVGIPRFLPHAAGFRFIEEVENLSKVLENPQKPVVVIISGIKEDKVEMAKELAQKFDRILVGGKLPVYFGNSNPNPEKMIIGNLSGDGEDITLDTIEKFKEEISKAGTIVLAGVPGKYEDPGHKQGTKEVFEAVANSKIFKVAGGGDTEAAISMLNLTDKFDWISVGGGAMLEFLAKRTLPGIKALLE